MPSTPPYVPTFNFAQDPAPQDLVNAVALQTQLQLIAANIADLITSLGVSIRDDNTLTDQLVRIRNLHPELADYINTVLTGTVVTNAVAYYYPVRAASIANVASLVGLQTVDGVALAEGDRVLLKDQTTTSQNGLWVVHAIGGPVVTGIWSRATDLPAGSDSGSGWGVQVSEGANNAETAWMILAGGSPLPVVGTDALTFFPIFSPYPVSIAHGGTGATTAAGARAALGAAGKATGAIVGDGVTTTFVVTHTLNTQDVVVSVRDATGNMQLADIVAVSVTQVSVTFVTAPVNLEALSVTVIG